MAKCASCGKGLLAKDREKRRCTKCKLPIGSQPPTMNYWSAEAKASYLRGEAIFPIDPDSPVRHFDCQSCKDGRHEECTEQWHAFCECLRNFHEESFA